MVPDYEANNLNRVGSTRAAMIATIITVSLSLAEGQFHRSNSAFNACVQTLFAVCGPNGTVPDRTRIFEWIEKNAG